MASPHRLIGADAAVGSHVGPTQPPHLPNDRSGRFAGKNRWPARDTALRCQKRLQIQPVDRLEVWPARDPHALEFGSYKRSASIDSPSTG